METFYLPRKKKDFYKVKNPILPMTTFYLQGRKKLIFTGF